MDALESVVDFLNNLVWNTPSAIPVMIIALLSYGLFITIRLGFIQLRQFGHGLKVVRGAYDNPDETGDVNHFQALSTALSATVGIGNIAGVAIAIHYGGPGALFWMWITAFLGMAVKYSECLLAVKYRVQNADGSVSGGPMYYIEKGLGANWKWLAVSFAFLAVICSFLTGNAVQSNTVADTLQSTFLIPKYATGIITASIVGIVIIGGIKRIGRVTARLTPLMGLIYVAGALLILILNADQILPGLWLIVSSAFNPTTGAYGVGSGAFMLTMVWGIKRGLFSNEAGQGSAPIAHGAAKTEEPVREGVVALLEPFIDTLVICTMTGLVIITTGVWDQKHPSSFTPINAEVQYVVDDTMDPEATTLIVEDGLVTNGTVIFNDVAIEPIYVDDANTETFTGLITVGEGVSFSTMDGEEVGRLHGAVIENGAPLTALAFEEGLPFEGGRYIVTICVLMFAISTSISWSYYGDRAIQYLAGDRSILPYKVVYIAMHFVGAVLTLEVIWTIGDIALGLMTFPNLIALFALSGVVYKSTKEYFDRMAKSSDS